MKKVFFLLFISIGIVFSGCTTVQTTPVYLDVAHDDFLCDDCQLEVEDPQQESIESDVVQKPGCVKRTKVVHYRSKCSCSYSFPVTVREKSNCKSGDAL